MDERNPGPPPASESSPPDREITIRDLAAPLWQGRWLVVLGAFVGIVIGLMVLVTASPVYTARLVAGPPDVDKARSQSIAGILNDLPLAGILGGAGDTGLSPYKRYLVTLTSVRLAESLQREHKLLQRFLPGRWNEQTQTWVPAPDVVSRISRGLNGLLGLPSPPEPDATLLAKLLKRDLVVSTDRRENITTITYNSTDPVFALQMLRNVHNGAEKLLREQASRSNQDSSAYIQIQLERVTNETHRQVLIGLLSQIEADQLLLSSNSNYGAQIIDPPYVDSQRVWPPSIFMVLVSGAFIGVVLAVAFILVSAVLGLRAHEKAAASINGLAAAAGRRLTVRTGREA